MTSITVNGEAREASARTTLADLVGEWSASPRGIAIALNGDVVPRSAWVDTAVTEGDVVEIVTAAAGG